MLILFSLILMRMSGAIALNPILGRTNLPASARAAMAFAFSALLYTGFGGVLEHTPSGMLEYGVMLLGELLLGLSMGFVMELMFVTVRFASSVMDYTMGLSMAQIYDPQYNTQMTLTTGLFYALLAMLFLACDGHLNLIGLFYASARLIPFGQAALEPELARLMMGVFSWSILTGLQIAFPLMAMELVTEAAIGILMRIIPQINVFVVNFQLKILVGLLMLVFLFSPMSDRLYRIINQAEIYLWQMLGLF